MLDSQRKTLLKKCDTVDNGSNLYVKDNDSFDYEKCLSLEKLAKDGLDNW